MVPYEPSSNDFFGNHQELSEKSLRKWKRFLKSEEANKLKNRIERRKEKQVVYLVELTKNKLYV